MDSLVNIEGIFSFLKVTDINGLKEIVSIHKYSSNEYKDNFFVNEDNLLAWYKLKNPENNIMVVANPKMPEFTLLIKKITMDLLKIINESKYPKKHNENLNNNDTKKTSYELSNKITNDRDKKIINNVLTKISVAITTELPYMECTHIYTDYIKIMSGAYFELTDGVNEYDSEIFKKYVGNNYIRLDGDKYKSYCDQQIDFILQILKTPYMIYPTFHQLDYYTVVKTISAPVINFLITHNRKKIHGYFSSPCEQINHDVMFHSMQTHFRFLHLAFNSYTKISLPLIINNVGKSYYRLEAEPTFTPGTVLNLIEAYENILNPFITTFKSYKIIPSRRLNIKLTKTETETKKTTHYTLDTPDDTTTINNLLMGCLFILFHEDRNTIQISEIPGNYNNTNSNTNTNNGRTKHSFIINNSKELAEYIFSKMQKTMYSENGFTQALVRDSLDTFNFEGYTPNDYDDEEELDEGIVEILANTFLEKLGELFRITDDKNQQSGGKFRTQHKYDKNKITKNNTKLNKTSIRKTKNKY